MSTAPSTPSLPPVEPSDPPATPRPTRSRTATAVAGLTAFAVGLPLVRVLADAPEFFIAHDMSPDATTGFWLGVSIGLPLLAALASALPLPGARSLRAPIVAVLGALAMAGVLQPLSSLEPAFWILTIAGAALLVHHVGRTPAVTDTLAIGAVGCVLVAGWAVGPSRVGHYVRSGATDAVAVEATDPAPLVVLVFDEMPLTALLDSELSINAERFPSFAALADTSTWYRLAASGSPNTAYAVPALLSGSSAEVGAVPVASAHPDNLFLQLAGTHEVHAFESLTALCPREVCSETAGPGPEADTEADAVDGRRRLVGDLSVVLRHALGTDEWRETLPPISQGWSGFEVTEPPTSITDATARQLVFDGSTFDREIAELLEVVDAPPTGDRPLAVIAHVTAPHAPWTALPGGDRYPQTEPAGSEVVDSLLHWSDGEAGRREGHQRLLLQIGALDDALGEARARLEANGMWDEATVVVTADHGMGFEPGYWRDALRNGVEVTGVPLFIKAPGQDDGRVDDRAVIAADVAPTALGLSRLRSPTDFEGLDLERDEVPARREGTFVTREHGALTPEQSLEALTAVVRRRARWIDPDGGWAAVHQPGVPDAVVGRALADIAPGSEALGSWARPAGDTGRQLIVTVSGVPAASAGPVIASCRGVVVGAVPWDALVEGRATLYLARPCDPAQLGLAVWGRDGLHPLTSAG